MKIKYLIPLSIILTSSAYAALIDGVVASDAGGNWSSASTWTTPDGAVPEANDADTPYTSLTLGNGKLVIDANASTPYVNRIVAGSASEIEITEGKTFYVKEVNETGDDFFLNGTSSAKQSLTFSGNGTLLFDTDVNTYITYATLTLNSKTDFSGSGHQILLSTQGKLYINGATSNSKSASIIMTKSNSYMAISSNFKTKRINNWGGGDVDVLAGSSLTVQRDIYLHGGAKFNVYGTVDSNATGYTSNDIYGYLGRADMTIGTNASHNSTLTIAKGGVMTIGTAASAQNKLGLHNAGSVVVQGSLSLAENLRMFNGSKLVMDGGTLKTNLYNTDGSVAETPKADIIICNYDANSEKGSDYAWNTVDAEDNPLNTTVTLQVKQSGSLGTIYMTDMSGIEISGTETTNTTLTIDFASAAAGTQFVIEDILGLFDSTSSSFARIISLKDYIDGMLKVKTMLETYDDGSLLGMFTSDGEQLYQWTDGTISRTQIPEPATYAGILGALAIALAFMRRQPRK